MGIRKFNGPDGRTAWALTHIDAVKTDDGRTLRKVIDELSLGASYDVSSLNNGVVFSSLSALLNDENIDTLIPVYTRKGGMSIKFIQGTEGSSDNKYVQYQLTKDTWSTDPDDWTTGGGNYPPEGGVPKSDLSEEVQTSLNKADNSVSTPEGAGQPGQVLQLDSNGVPAWVTPSAGSTPDSTMSRTSTNAVQNKVISNEFDNYAKTDGYYETLGVGEAKNIIGQIPQDAGFIYRTAGGSSEIADGLSHVKKIQGNSIVWNQLVKNGNFTNKSEWIINGGTWSVSNNTATATWNYQYTNGGFYQKFYYVKSHKYYVHAKIKNLLEETRNYRIGQAYGVSINRNYEGNETKIISSILTIATASGTGYDNFGVTGTVNIENSIEISEVMCIDLTIIYGAGKEATIEQFEADYQRRFGKPLDYEPYNEGTLIPMKMQGIKTVGFNQYNPTTGIVKGLVVDGGYQITGTYTKIYPRVDSFTDYTYGSPVGEGIYYVNSSNHYLGKKTVAAYNNAITYALGSYCTYNDAIYKANVAITTAEEWDATHWDLIADVTAMVTEGILSLWDITPNANGIFTIEKAGDIVVNGGDDTTCVHFVYDGYRNGEYEPYKEHNYDIDVTRVWGKLNGEGSYVQIAPDGLKSVTPINSSSDLQGAIADLIEFGEDGATADVKVGSVDLGDYDYTKQGNLYTTSGLIPPKANILFSRGKGVVWNQLVGNGNFAQGGNTPSQWGGYQVCDNSNEDYINIGSGSGNFHSTTAKHIKGHKYYIHFRWRTKVSNARCVVLGDTDDLIAGSVDNWAEVKQIRTATKGTNVTYGSIGFLPRTTVDIDKKVGVNLIDLTQIFGAGNEPATVAKFEAMFPLDYYNYDSGSLGLLSSTTYADAAAFKAAMQGVPLYYELANLLHYTDLMLDKSVAGDGSQLEPITNVRPIVDNYGTEEIKVPTSQDDVPSSCNPWMTIQYDINAAEHIDTFEKHGIKDVALHDNLQALCNVINANCSEQLGGTISISAEPNDSLVYSFTFTANAQTQSVAPQNETV